MKRILSLCLSIVMLINIGFSVSYITNASQQGTGCITNSFYDDNEAAGDNYIVAPRVYANYHEVDSYNDAVAYVRDEMVKRSRSISVKILSGVNYDWKKLFYDAMSEEYSSNEKSGDYLKWVYEKVSYRYYSNSCSYEVFYYTTKAQEDYVDTKIAEIKQKLNLTNCSQLTIIRAVYDYIMNNVEYQYDNAGVIKHTAYSALCYGKAVCQGYSTLLYRLLKEYGISNRIIVSNDHSWNIAQIGDVYYNLDVTWDDERNDYRWFLKGSNNFENHIPIAEYNNKEFNNKYPVSEIDYDINCVHSYNKLNVVKPTCTEKGFEIFRCNNCGDSYNDNYTEKLKHNVVIDKAVASTCTNTGLTEGKHCSVCNTVLVKQNVASALGHKTTTTTTKQPTCKATGVKTTKCTVCNTVTKTEAIAKKQHIIVTIPAVKATYVKGGKTAGKRCKTCGVVTQKQKATAKLKLKAPSSLKVAAKKKSFKLTWKRVTAASGYEIRYSTSSKFTKKTTKTVKITKNKTVSKTILKLKGKKKYYVQIRSYKNVKVNGKTQRVYSSWSKAKSIKTK